MAMEFLCSWFHPVRRVKLKPIATEKKPLCLIFLHQIKFLRYVKKWDPIGVSSVHLNLSNTYTQIYRVHKD